MSSALLNKLSFELSSIAGSYEIEIILVAKDRFRVIFKNNFYSELLV